MSNGLRVVLQEMHQTPVASFWIWYRVGSRNELPGLTGISHWVEHMLFKGTPSFPHGQFDKLVAREGGVFNGMTWIDWTTYFETLPSDRFDLALRIESDRMANSLLDDIELAKERTVIISEREGAENLPQWLLGEEVRASAFRVHPYRHQVLGWKQDLRALTRDDLWRHYRSYYTPSNAVAVAVGDFVAGELLERIEGLFGSIPATPEPPPVRTVELPQVGERRVVVEGHGRTAYVQMAFVAAQATHDDYFPLAVLDAVLGGAKAMSLSGGARVGNRSSRLYRALVESQLASEVHSSVRPTIDPFLFSFAATVRPEHTALEVENALSEALDRVAQEPISTHELAKAIKQARAQFAYSSETVTSRAYWIGFSEVVASAEWFSGYVARLSAVTPADVQRVAQQYLRKSRRTVGWYLPT
jgi:zinc protease